MAKKSSDNNTNSEKEQQAQSAESFSASVEAQDPIEKPILPRKRAITRNVQLPVAIAIVAAALLFLFVWKSFFDQTIIGQWHLDVEGSYESTADNAESEDTAQVDYSQRLGYEFTEDGDCIVTLGSMTVNGSYQLASTSELGNVMSAQVLFDNSPIFYGTFSYKVRGNAFTGRRIEIIDAYDSSAEVMVLEEGGVEDPLTPYDEPQLDDKLVGTWNGEDSGTTYEFTKDGFVTRTSIYGLTVRQAYTVMDGGFLLMKYVADTEESYTSAYEFDGNDLVIDGEIFKKISE